MLIVVSPAKTLDYETPLPTDRYTQPAFLDQSAQLIERCRTLTPVDIAKLMKVSDKIASLNAVRFADWAQPFSPDNARPAIFAFKGDVYTGLDAFSLSEASLAWAQQHFRMLSGLYGILKPLDLMQPYRLEMGTKLDNIKGANLYQFWGSQLAEALNQELAAEETPVLINLASNEYFKAVPTKALKAQVITPVFKDLKNGQYKMISFFAKKARGMMARYLMDQQATSPEIIKSFDVAGYYFVPELSTTTEWVFHRDAPEA
ncbi:Peroxide stress resistance protein YaaA [Vibrio stylophorae]|uniref:UPF0246 protein VST7929_00509 n=1 Tax=Vibrio stylophorae TaxID=659351 RepID=A0ABM8ZQU2_9VIBR|nr:peroxide stress protein YaaA [Vibrio stylophorae]CAH0532668.1 Peroxide stress resistance protein YaaA [Vibrio stylophorae]